VHGWLIFLVLVVVAKDGCENDDYTPDDAHDGASTSPPSLPWIWRAHKAHSKEVADPCAQTMTRGTRRGSASGSYFMHQLHHSHSPKYEADHSYGDATSVAVSNSSTSTHNSPSTTSIRSVIDHINDRVLLTAYNKRTQRNKLD